MDVKKLCEDEGKKRLNKLIDFEDWIEECENCRVPQLLHKGAYTQQTQPEEGGVVFVWRDFRNNMRPLVDWMRRSRDTEKTETLWTKGLQDLIESLKSKEAVNKEEKAVN